MYNVKENEDIDVNVNANKDEDVDVNEDVNEDVDVDVNDLSMKKLNIKQINISEENNKVNYDEGANMNFDFAEDKANTKINSSLLTEKKLFEKLKNKCLNLIAMSMRTEKNIRDKIKQGKIKYDETLINKVIENLKEYNYINDKAFAERFIELNKNKYSSIILKQKLLLKGINNELATNTLKDYFDEDNEKEVCKKVLYKKYKDYDQIKNELDYKEKSKIFAYLIRKGFKYEVVEEVMT